MQHKLNVSKVLMNPVHISTGFDDGHKRNTLQYWMVVWEL